MVLKLSLPFPYLSDPDRSGAIEPFDVADPKDPREIARPATIVLDGEHEEVFRRVARDFADRPIEDELIDVLEGLELPPVQPEAVEVGPSRPGPKAMPREHLRPYYRGARFAAVALRMRVPEVSDEAERYIAQLDHYREVVRELEE